MAIPFITEFFRRATEETNKIHPNENREKHEVVLGLKIEFLLTKPSSQRSQETRAAIQNTLQAWANKGGIFHAARFAYEEYDRVTQSPDRKWLIYPKAYDLYREELLIFLAKNMRKISCADRLDDLRAAHKLLDTLSALKNEDSHMGVVIRATPIDDAPAYRDKVRDKINELENPPSAEVINLFTGKRQGPGQSQ